MFDTILHRLHLTHNNRLEVFNSVTHNVSDNPNLIYAILSSHNIFEDLGTFTLTRGLREIKRAQVLKEEQAQKADGTVKSRGSEESRESSDPGAEKSRLLSEEDQPNTEGETSVEGGSPEEAEEGRASNSTTRASEKARGKMRERRSSSIDVVGVPATSVGRNGFVPTQEWVRDLFSDVILSTK